jgi:hypothetical protein
MNTKDNQETSFIDNAMRITDSILQQRMPELFEEQKPKAMAATAGSAY